MTRAEWNSTMQRYMHRTDLAADLDRIWEYASNLFFNAWLKPDGRAIYATDDALLAAAPAPLHHAGLMYLHQLAQDDVQLQRELALFRAVMGDFVVNYSLQNIAPVMMCRTETGAPNAT